jgi:4'-phosphopantetheinyl transferase
MDVITRAAVTDATAALPRPADALAAGEIHIWWMSTRHVDLSQLAEADELLSDLERARRRRLAFPDLRRDFTLARALVRTTLSHYADVPAAAWRFAANAYGRPEIEAPATPIALRFNLSHTCGLVACAVTATSAVGLDVERLAWRAELLSIARRHFSSGEIRDLEAAPTVSAREALFFSMWTLKEAYAKARCLGLSLPLDATAFRIDADGEVEARLGGDERQLAATWHLKLIDELPGYRMALAATRSAKRAPLIRLRQASPRSFAR